MNYKKLLLKAVHKKFGGDQEKLDWWFSKHSSARRRFLCQLWDKDPHCAYCRKLTLRPNASNNNSKLRATYEHKIPLIKGGTDNRSNATLSCSSCNALKGEYTHDEFIKLIENNEIGKNLKEKRGKSRKRKKLISSVENEIMPKRENKVKRMAFYISLLMFNDEISLLVSDLIKEGEQLHQKNVEILNKLRENDRHAEEICRSRTMGSGT